MVSAPTELPLCLVSHSAIMSRVSVCSRRFLTICQQGTKIKEASIKKIDGANLAYISHLCVSSVKPNLPKRRNVILIYDRHTGNVKRTEPHRGGKQAIRRMSVPVFKAFLTYSPSQTADNGLFSPAMDILHVSKSPQQIWCIAPGPYKLPHDGRYP